MNLAVAINMPGNQYFYITLLNEYSCNMTHDFLPQLAWNTEYFSHACTHANYIYTLNWRWSLMMNSDRKILLPFAIKPYTQTSSSASLALWSVLFIIVHIHAVMRRASYFSTRQSESCGGHTGTLGCRNSPSWLWHGMLV